MERRARRSRYRGKEDTSSIARFAGGVQRTDSDDGREGPPSADPEELQRPSVTLAQHVVQRLVGLAGQAGIASEQARRAVARHLAQLAVANRVGHAKGRLAA